MEGTVGVKNFLLVIAIAAGGFFAYAMLRPDDPQTTAKLKCEFAIERTTGYDLGIMEVAGAMVIGDVFNGRVSIPFERSGKYNLALCVFENGNIRSVFLNEKLLAGRP